jgi:hypothetical protein
MRQRLNEGTEQHFHLAAHHVHHRRTAALVRNVHELRARERVEKLSAEMVEAADADEA